MENRYIVMVFGHVYYVADREPLKLLTNRFGFAFQFFDRETAQAYADALNNGEVTP